MLENFATMQVCNVILGKPTQNKVGRLARASLLGSQNAVAVRDKYAEGGNYSSDGCNS